jgi:hypothetical protein
MAVTGQGRTKLNFHSGLEDNLNNKWRPLLDLCLVYHRQTAHVNKNILPTSAKNIITRMNPKSKVGLYMWWMILDAGIDTIINEKNVKAKDRNRGGMP